MTDLRLCLIILNWNSVADTCRALECLAEAEWTILVVDNASNNPTETTEIRLAHPDIDVLESPQNLGYAGGMNLGLKWAIEHDFTHALLLNPDTLPSVAVVDAMIKQSEGCAVVGTAQVTQDLKPYVSAALLSGHKPTPFICETACGRGHEVDIVSGAAILMELQTAQEMDFMDESFFHYKEEFDYCYRVKVSGRRLRYSCGVPLVHKRGGSLPSTSSAAIYYSFRNEMLFLRKHLGSLGWIFGLGVFRNAMVTGIKHPMRSYAALKGLYHGMRGISGPISSGTSAGDRK